MARFVGENRFDSLVSEAAARWRIPEWFIKAVIATESSFRPGAHRDEPRIGDASRGLMQVLHRTARALGYQGETGDPVALTGLYDPRTSIELGTKLLRELVDRYPLETWDGIYAAYNGGRVRRDTGGDIAYTSTANRKAVERFRRQMEYFQPMGPQPAPPGWTAPAETAPAPPSVSPPGGLVPFLPRPRRQPGPFPTG